MRNPFYCYIAHSGRRYLLQFIFFGGVCHWLTLASVGDVGAAALVVRIGHQIIVPTLYGFHVEPLYLYFPLQRHVKSLNVPYLYHSCLFVKK